MRFIICLSFILLTSLCYSQLHEGATAAQTNPVEYLPFENIGPTVFSGRVSDLEVNPADPTKFYVAYASGGLWYTDNNGTSFDPIFDHEDVITIGDFAVDWENDRIWLGSGEVNSSRSSYSGKGMYMSEDHGKSWTKKGLEDTHHIGRVLVHPENADHIIVAALGHLYSANKERGIFLSTDQGATWSKTLYINENCGVVDLVRAPNNPNILYAAAWERERRAWDFVESGEGSGIYKSVDGGTSWTKLSGGFPQGEGVGRIGLSISYRGDTTRIYALLDNYSRRPDEDKDDQSLTKGDFKSMSNEAFKKLSDKELSSYLEDNNFPKKYDVESVRTLIKNKKAVPADLASYLENANSLLFDTPVIAAELYASDDEGKTWKKTHDDYLDRVYNSYGYYFGLVSAHPKDLNEVFIGGVPLIRSADGGKTFKYIGSENVHSDHHALWINPARDGHIINGNDGGINISYDDGQHWIKCNSPSVGQFYHIAVDMDEPYHVYGGLQDNGVWKGKHTYKANSRWHSTGKYPYQALMGGDGMQTAIDTRDNQTFYTGYQFGNYFRINSQTGERKKITPTHDLGEAPLRWNWMAPIHLSNHNQDIFYMGANKLFRSMDQGEHFEAISEDLTKGGKQGDVPYGTLSAIHESPLQFGLIYTGSDDGNVHVTQDGGHSWTLITEGLPADRWVSRIQASSHNKGSVYVALNGYRNDDFKPYLYRSDDFGQTWTSISQTLPDHPVNVIKEDPEQVDILYVGTDFGSYISFDQGGDFKRLKNGLPHVPVHDIVIHPRDHHMLIGTHGRSIYKADISAIRNYQDIKNEEIVIFNIEKLKHNSNAGKIYASYREPVKQEIDMTIYSKTAGRVKVSLTTEKGKTLKEWGEEVPAGYSILKYDLSMDEKNKKHLTTEDKVSTADNGLLYLPKGSYQLVVKKNGTEKKENLILE